MQWKGKKETSYGSLVKEPSIQEREPILPDDEVLDGSDKYDLSLSQLKDEIFMSKLAICSILSTSFMYGCIMSTLFLLTLPIECQRIEDESKSFYHHSMSKNVCLGGYAAIAGLAQLITPLVGLISDNYTPPRENYPELAKLGRRLPYLLFGTFMVCVSILGQLYASSPTHIVANGMDENAIEKGGEWFQYTIFFTLHMIGLNIVYTVMIAFIPDLVPQSQTGIANGSLALMVTSGSLFGFGMFHFCLNQLVSSMYKMYFFVAFTTGLITYIFVCNREKELWDRINKNPSLKSYNTINDEKSKHIEDITTSFWTLPQSLLHLMLYEPISSKGHKHILSVYQIDMDGDFFWVTISRFFYYLGISSQTFFLYFIHDELQGTMDPEAAVSYLAIVGQCAGAITCYPIGILSDKYFGSKRRPFLYFSCAVLAFGNICLLWCSTLSEMVKDCLLLGAANGIYLTMDTSIACDTLDSEGDGIEKNNGDKGAAELLGIWGVFGFLGTALGPLIGAMVLMSVGKANLNDQNQSDMIDGNEESMKYNSFLAYVIVFSLSALYFSCSALSLTRIKNQHI